MSTNNQAEPAHSGQPGHHEMATDDVPPRTLGAAMDIRIQREVEARNAQPPLPINVSNNLYMHNNSEEESFYGFNDPSVNLLTTLLEIRNQQRSSTNRDVTLDSGNPEPSPSGPEDLRRSDDVTVHPMATMTTTFRQLAESRLSNKRNRSLENDTIMSQQINQFGLYENIPITESEPKRQRNRSARKSPNRQGIPDDVTGFPGNGISRTGEALEPTANEISAWEPSPTATSAESEASWSGDSTSPNETVILTGTNTISVLRDLDAESTTATDHSVDITSQTQTLGARINAIADNLMRESMKQIEINETLHSSHILNNDLTSTPKITERTKAPNNRLAPSEAEPNTGTTRRKSVNNERIQKATQELLDHLHSIHPTREPTTFDLDRELAELEHLPLPSPTAATSPARTYSAALQNGAPPTTVNLGVITRQTTRKNNMLNAKNANTYVNPVTLGPTTPGPTTISSGTHQTPPTSIVTTSGPTRLTTTLTTVQSVQTTMTPRVQSHAPTPITLTAPTLPRKRVTISTQPPTTQPPNNVRATLTEAAGTPPLRY